MRGMMENPVHDGHREELWNYFHRGICACALGTLERASITHNLIENQLFLKAETGKEQYFPRAFHQKFQSDPLPAG